MGLITRQGKGSKLTVQEMDGNLEYLRGSYKVNTNGYIDWSEASMQEFNVVDDVDFDFVGAVAGQELTLLLNQSSGNIGWTSSVKWVNDVTPVITSDVKLDTAFDIGTGFNNSVYPVVLQSDGKILVGGFFTEYDGQSIGRIARLNLDGSLDTTFVTGTGFNDGVYSIVLQSDGKILVVGDFDGYDGVSVGYIARLNTDGSLDTSFVTGTGFNNYVYPVVLQSDGKVLVGGTFDSYDGQSIGHIARLNSNGTLDNTFLTGSGFSGNVNSVTLQSDGKILVGGIFDQYDGQSIGNCIVRLNSNGSLDTTFVTGTGFNEEVSSITLQSDGKILVGGFFTEYDGQSIGNCIARLNSDGSLDTTFDTGFGFNNAVITMTLQSDAKILVGGFFTEYDGLSVARIARLNTDGSLDDTFVTGTGFNSDVRSITLQSDGKILVGGFFNEYNGVLVGYITRLSQLPTYKVVKFYYDGVNYIGKSLNQI